MTNRARTLGLVRRRQARTGESYSTARRHTLADHTRLRLREAVTADVHPRHGQSVAFTPDGDTLLTSGESGSLVPLDPTDARGRGRLDGHEASVTAVVVPRPGLAVSASSDASVRTWDLATMAPSAVLEGHRGTVSALTSVGPDRAVSCGYDRRLVLWDLTSAAAVTTVRAELERVAAIGQLPDGRLVEAGMGGRLALRDADTLEVTGYLDTDAPAVTAVAMSPYGDIVAVGWDHHVGLWAVDADDLATSQRIAPKGVYALAFDPDGRRLAQTGSDGTVRLWLVR